MKVNQSTGQTGGLQNANSASSADAAKKAGKTDSAKTRSINPEEGQAAKSTSADGSTAEISFRAKEMAKAKEIAAAAPDTREGKIAELKNRIQSGEYSVSANKIADKLVDEHIKTSAMS